MGCLMWPHLFPLYASQIFKTNKTANFKKLFSLRNWNIALRYSRSYQKFLSENVMTGVDTYLIHALFRAIYISYLSIALHYSRSYQKLFSENVMTRARLHIWLRKQKTIFLFKTKIKDRQKVFLNEHENLTIKPLIFKTILPSQLRLN